MKFSAVIFDLDGTIIESENAWGATFVKVLKSLGVVPKENHPQIRGASLKASWKMLIDHYSIKKDISLDELEVLTYLEYENHLDDIEVKSGFVEFMDFLKESGFQIGLATSTRWETANKILENGGIAEMFNCITTGEEVLNPKPDPEIFTLTADKLGVEREECLVIEDSVSGIEAARQARMKVIAITNGDNENDLSKADMVVEGFSEITPKVMDQL